MAAISRPPSDDTLVGGKVVIQDRSGVQTKFVSTDCLGGILWLLSPGHIPDRLPVTCYTFTHTNWENEK